MHTLYWHPDPKAAPGRLPARAAPGGHAVFLTYTRPARVVATFAEVRRQRGWWQAVRSLRWLLPTALFELFRHVTRRYLGPDEFRAALRAAGFEVLETRETFLAGISLLAWTRADGAPPAPERMISFSPVVSGRRGQLARNCSASMAARAQIAKGFDRL